ncbi:hypothetical protein ACNKHX_00960 [Shigella flexneri]
MNVPTVNWGWRWGCLRLRRPGLNWAYRLSVASGSAMLLGALNLTPIEVAEVFRPSPAGGTRAPLSALRSVIAETRKGAV